MVVVIFLFVEPSDASPSGSVVGTSKRAEISAISVDMPAFNSSFIAKAVPPTTKALTPKTAAVIGLANANAVRAPTLIISVLTAVPAAVAATPIEVKAAAILPIAAAVKLIVNIAAKPTRANFTLFAFSLSVTSALLRSPTAEPNIEPKVSAKPPSSEPCLVSSIKVITSSFTASFNPDSPI